MKLLIDFVVVVAVPLDIDDILPPFHANTVPPRQREFTFEFVVATLASDSIVRPSRGRAHRLDYSTEGKLDGTGKV